jgi:hypothetical protein
VVAVSRQRGDRTASPGRADGGYHGCDGVGQRHMLPEADYCPAGLGEGLVGGAVALDVPSQLRRPVPVVVLRLAAVVGAGVPEAAVNEDGDPPAGERDIRADPAQRQIEPEVLAVAVAHGVQRGAQRQFGLGVGAAVAPHVRRTARVDREWVRLALGGRLRRGPARRRVLGLTFRRPGFPGLRARRGLLRRIRPVGRVRYNGGFCHRTRPTGQSGGTGGRPPGGRLVRHAASLTTADGQRLAYAAPWPVQPAECR